MELVDSVQNKILDARKMIYDKEYLLQYADYILHNMNNSRANAEQMQRFSKIIQHVKMNIIDGLCSHKDAVQDLEWLSSKINSLDRT